MFWSDRFVLEIIKQKKEPLIIATGITPSGHIHFGNLREVLSAEAINRSLIKKGKKPRFLYIADDFDPLRKVYPFLPDSYEKYVGMPLTSIPDPFGSCHKNYAEHFLSEFFASLDELDIKVEKLSATEMYKKGKYSEVIKESLINKNKIIKILEECSGRKIPEGWSPFRPLCSKCGKMTTTKVVSEDLENNKVKYECECGNSSEADFSKGEGKLVWRVDWAARWKMLGVKIEPYGKDHGTKGGSHDTAVAMCNEVFHYDPPYGFVYDFILLKGTKGKMSSSKGNVISAAEMLSIVPPEVIRYIILKTQPQRFIQFNPGEGLLQAVDEFVRLEDGCKKGELDKDETGLYEISKIGNNERVIVPFGQLVNAIQAAQGDIDEIIRILERTGVKISDRQNFTKEVKRGQKWLKEYAPETVKFAIQKEVPRRIKEFSAKQKQLLSEIAKEMKKENNPEKLHNFIYETGKSLGLSPAESFKPIYISILNKEFGPKAGWFLVSLDKEFVINRFKEVKNA